MNNELEEFVQLNNISEEFLLEALHKDIRESVLSEICEYMKSSASNLVSIKKIYYRKSNSIDATRLVVQNVCHLALSESDIVWLDKCINAFLIKKAHRQHIPDSIRKGLWQKQDHKCCVCSKVISENDGHVDHIVPWDFVGDELENNYQLLCSACNLHKSNHVALTIHSLIFRKI